MILFIERKNFYQKKFDELLRKSHDLEKYISFSNYRASYDISCEIRYLLKRLIIDYKNDIEREPIYNEL